MRDEAVLKLNPEQRVVQSVAPTDRPATEPDPEAGRVKVEAPWSTPPWAVREYPRMTEAETGPKKVVVKTVVRTVDSLNRGGIIDIFC